MNVSSQQSGRLPALTGYRFILALGVFLFHALVVMQLFSGKTMQALSITAILGPLAVSSFFILSGFVLTWSASPRDTMPLF